MNLLKFLLVISVFSVLLVTQSSCVVVNTKDNGKHKGWFKNSNNPHHPATTNPGKSRGKSKGKGNGKK